MGDSFEPYHVPQQHRGDKLRILPQNHLETHFHSLLPLYDPSQVSLVKEQGVSFMGSYWPLNPNDNNSNSNSNSNSNTTSIVYTPQSLQVLRDFDHYGGGGFRAEPLSLELNLQRYDGSVLCNDHNMVNPGAVVRGSTGSSNEVWRSLVPLGPFTGYASILKGSRFLKPAQQLLNEFCDVGTSVYGDKRIYVVAPIMEPPVECFSGNADYSCGGDDFGGESVRKKSILNSMLDEVYRRYKLYYQQLQAVLASFECVAGLGNAAPYANFALKGLSKHFRFLKNAIIDNLQFTSKAHGQLGDGKDVIARLGSTDSGVYDHRPIHNSGFVENHPIWRPQRGLPERAVTVLRAWLFEHFLHPYPTDSDKLMLAKQTGLSRNQVSNWFINARVRLWKPMVEEIHSLETRQGQKAYPTEERYGNNRSNVQASLSNSIVSSNASASIVRAPQDVLPKRTRNQFPDLPTGNKTPPNLSYNCLPSNPQVGIGVSMASGSSSVSLTLGLQQHNGVGLSEPFPITAAQRFGLDHPDANAEAYLMVGYEAQNRQFGRDVAGGQLLRDFVG